MLAEFHWLRPLWLLLLPAVTLAGYLAWRYHAQPNPWQQLLPAHLQQVLLPAQQQQQSRRTPFLLAVVALWLLVLAAAGPSVSKLPQPAFSLQKATVLVLDMSMSMHATDVKPDRATQARFKALDFASQLAEGELALVTFAGDAYVISPLTPDHNNIKLLLPDLKPEIMPVQGSDLTTALELASKILLQAGYPKGDIVVISDGFSSEHFIQLRNMLDQFPHRLSVLAVGTAEGAPVRLTSGELLKDQQGSIVIPKVPLTQLKQLATLTGGVFVQHSFDQRDVQALLDLPALQLADEVNPNSQLTGDQWQDAGVYLCWLLLPLALWLGKRGSVLALFAVLLLPPPTQAVEWQDLWQSRIQQAQQAYQAKDYDQARQKFDQPLWQGNAAYRSGDFSNAEQFYRQDPSAAGQFNLGNALAQQQKYQQALQAYQQAKQQNPELAGLQQNIELIEQLAKQQQAAEQQQNSDGQSDQQQQGEGQPSQGQPANDQQSQEQQAQNGEQSQNQDGQSNEANPSGQSAGDQQQQAADSKEPQADAGSKQQANDQATEQQKAAAAEQPKTAEKAITEAWPNATPEQSQQFDGLMRKVQDDPSLLLRNKMQLEYQKRQQLRLPKGVQEEW